MSAQKKNEDLLRLAASFLYPTYVEGIHIGDSDLTKIFMAEERAHYAAFDRDLFDPDNDDRPEPWKSAANSHYAVSEIKVVLNKKGDPVEKELRHKRPRFHRNTLAGVLFLARFKTHLIRYRDEAYGTTTQRMAQDSVILAGVTSNFKELEVKKDNSGRIDMSINARDLVEFGFMNQDPFAYAWEQYESMLVDKNHRIKFDGEIQPDRVVESIIRKYVLAIHHALNSYFPYKVFKMFNEQYDAGLRNAEKLGKELKQHLHKSRIARESWESEYRTTINEASHQTKLLSGRMSGLMRNLENLVESTTEKGGAINSLAETIELISATTLQVTSSMDSALDRLDIVRKKGSGALNNINIKYKDIMKKMDDIGVDNFKKLVDKLGTEDYFEIDEEQLLEENDVLNVVPVIEVEGEDEVIELSRVEKIQKFFAKIVKRSKLE